ncbi:glycosyltransferase family 57 protein [Pleomassaria siparia CBS 279.74]|uniref:Glycosyltransferase family 57 protein n=1 Tax=Pleomassaria siparia CBS 279.74 TaxID=1314801 RepID=A0A6G1KPK7_9PLEO|nr:glycosyltransferase family 57 protein [Pleomassaria siparia CBS 279.74]
MSELYPSIAQCAIVATALKVLLFPAYKSTDFEVHRNWLALTHSLPIKEWYYEKTSEWTLDYPPFFAYFEWLLSQAAAYLEPALLNVQALHYDSWQTIYFQRATVILTELVLAYALHLYVKGSRSKTTSHAAALSVLLSPGLLIIDHIHFQYNGFLYGILILSLVLARNDSTLLSSGLLFAVLLCFKHIYLYLAPAYFVYLLRAYCLGPSSSFPHFKIRFFNCIKLGAGIVVVFAAAFGPFALWNQLEQVFRRLFPFSRGLCHAYWAPNVWALYSFTDRVLIYLAPRLGLKVDQAAVNSVTRGLVGDSSFAVLPDVVPLACFLLTLAFQIPFLVRLLVKPTWETFIGAVTLCGYASFLFGWHVHEKAILIVLIPFSLIALRDRRYFGAFRPLAVAGHVSLFPLLFTAAEFPVKTVYTIFWLGLFLCAFDRLVPASPHPRIFLLDRFSFLYIAVSIPLIAYCSLAKVHYKRKPVKFDAIPPFIDDNTEVWAIEATGEVYLDYEKYLSRHKNFTCEATGHSNYTFFEAMDSEVCFPYVTPTQTEASIEINSIFPEGLRARVLQYIQFKNTARMDDLEHYAEGDRVSIEHDNARRYGIISSMQDTSRLHNIFTGGDSPDDQYRSFTYHITLENSGEQLAKYKASELSRDRRVYSKLVLKQFLRGAVSREAWNGAPWLIKEHLAKRYGIDTKVPDAKTRDAVMAAKKAANNANANHANYQATPPGMSYPPNGHNGQSDQNGTSSSANGQTMYAPPPQQQQQQQQQQQGQGQTNFVNFAANHHPPFRPNLGQPMIPPPMGGPPRPYQNFPPPIPNQRHFPPMPPHTIIPGNLPPHLAHHMPPPGPGLPISLPFQNNFMQYQTLAPTNMPPPHPHQHQHQPQPSPQHLAPPPRPFEPVKYPIEDLRIRTPRLQTVRPPLKFFSDDVPEGAEAPKEDEKTGILMKSVGPLLCVWETLNVHDTIYSLDSFTLDDFVGAMRFSSEEVECELQVEVHCSVLKQIINDSGQLQVPLPKIEESDDSENGESAKSTSPEPEPEPPVRTTRSSLRKSEANAIVVKPRTPSPEPPKQIHKAAEFLAEYDWLEQCKIRDFQAGGWQAMLVGLLYHLSFSPTQKEHCDEILAELVPPDEQPSLESIAVNYVYLDVNLRIAALEMILRLTVATEVFRDQLTAASQEMTRLRKEKIDYQKKRKELADELFKLDIDRKIGLPLNSPPSPADGQNVSMTGTEEAKEDSGNDSAEETLTTANRKLRHTKQNKRKRGTDKEKKEKAKKAKAEAAKSKQQKEWEKLLAAIESKKEELKSAEASINELDDDLRETLVHRSKVLGKDRFLNKYYWFEHNGMPYGGVPTSSTAQYGYANGRLWVQGPDEYEFQPNLVEPALTQDLQELGYTVPQRKEKEEGLTHLSNSREWGYYDDPKDIDALMAWLDERGHREKVLRKEIQAFRDNITKYMLKMKEHLSEINKAKADHEEPSTRISTRTKTNAEKDTTTDHCLLWTNGIMRSELGYNHSEEYEPEVEPEPEPQPPKKAGKKGTAKATKTKGKR